MENQTGLQIEIATSLRVLEQKKKFLWVGICIEIVHTKFRDPRFKKIRASVTLERRVPKKAFSAKN